MLIGKGYTDRFLVRAEVREIFQEALAQMDAIGKQLLVIIPDDTRSAPVPLCYRLFAELLGERATKLDFLIALGTHIAIDEECLLAHLGITAEERATKYARIGVCSHDWQRPHPHRHHSRRRDPQAERWPDG